MTVRGIHHVGLVVDDLDAAVTFYSALLKMDVVERDHWRAPSPLEDQAVGLNGSSADGAMLYGSGSYLEIWKYSSPDSANTSPGHYGAHEPGLRHLAIEVDDVEATLRHVIELGGSAMGQPARFENEAVVVYCRDPFGTILELMSTGPGGASLDDARSR